MIDPYCYADSARLQWLLSLKLHDHGNHDLEPGLLVLATCGGQAWRSACYIYEHWKINKSCANLLFDNRNDSDLYFLLISNIY